MINVACFRIKVKKSIHSTPPQASFLFFFIQPQNVTRKSGRIFVLHFSIYFIQKNQLLKKGWFFTFQCNQVIISGSEFIVCAKQRLLKQKVRKLKGASSPAKLRAGQANLLLSDSELHFSEIRIIT
jgi:hypothetical protein